MPTHRTCTSCHETKTVDDFHRKATGSQGRSAYCKICCKKMQVGYRRKSLARRAAQCRKLYWANPEVARAVARAHQTVLRAITRGELVRPDSCSQCGSVGMIQAAHHDYTDPLNIRWLCPSCHTLWDKAAPKYPRF